MTDHTLAMRRTLPAGKRREVYAAAAADLMSRPAAYKAALLRVTREWPEQCQTNLAAEHSRLWLNLAACYLAVQSPAECTRLGWQRLTHIQQNRADVAADEVITAWRKTRTGQVAVQAGLFDISEALGGMP